MPKQNRSDFGGKKDQSKEKQEIHGIPDRDWRRVEARNRLKQLVELFQMMDI